MIFRIGLGNDIHKLSSESKHLFIGGVDIPFDKGVVAHSDGDVLIHSICDAILGAMANRAIIFQILTHHTKILVVLNYCQKLLILQKKKATK